MTHSQMDDDLNQQLIQLYPQLLAFARHQLPQHAEDLVQEAMTNALVYRHQFKGRSAFKTWVFSILKHKMVDFIRSQKHHTAFSQLNQDEEHEQMVLNALFDQSGHWQAHALPTYFNDSWAEPDREVENAHFWRILELCLTQLPAEQGRAFLMREYLDLDSQDICREMNISRDKYYVLIHRARLKLQTCLATRWFE